MTLTAARTSTSEARDRAQMILGAASLVIWFVVAFGLAVAWYVDDNTPQPIFMAGGIALLAAAIPWLGYAPLVSRMRKHAGRTLAPEPSGPKVHSGGQRRPTPTTRRGIR